MRNLLTRIEGDLELLSFLLTKACRTIPRDGGASKLKIAQKTTFDIYIRRLAHIYEHTTGKRAAVDWSGGGDFVDFVAACLRPIDPKRCPESGLGKPIWRALHPKEKTKNGFRKQDRT
jgi:hypothetical protein